MSDALVLDSSAVLALLQDERGADDVEALLAAATASGSQHLMNSVNWAEVLYIASRDVPNKDMAAVITAVDVLPIRLVDADRELSITAAGFKNSHRLGLADAYAAALAVFLGLPLATADADFDVLAEDGLQVRRIR